MLITFGIGIKNCTGRNAFSNTRISGSKLWFLATSFQMELSDFTSAGFQTTLDVKQLFSTHLEQLSFFKQLW